MILRKVTTRWVHELPTGRGLCVLVPGALLLDAAETGLPGEWERSVPGAIVCAGCDPYLERLLNERGVPVLRWRDTLDGVADGAEVTLDPAGGTLTDLSSGRRHALVPLAPAHLAALNRHV